MPFDQLSAGSVVRDGTRLIANFVRAHPWSFFLALIGSVIFAGTILAASYVIGWVTDTLVIPVLREGAEVADLVLPAVVAIMAVALMKAIGVIFRRASAGWLAFKSRQDLRNRLVAHQLRLKMSWFDRQATGDLLAVADADVNQATGVLHPLPYASGVTLLVLGALAMVFAMDIWLGVGALIGLSVIIGINLRGSWISYWLWEEVQKNRGRVTAMAHESFDGALTVKSLGREEYVSRHFRDASEELRDGLIELLSSWRSYQAIVRALPQALTLILLLVGVFRIQAGVLTPGDIVTVAYLLALLVFPVQFLGFILWEVASSLASWQRVASVLDVDEFMPYGTGLGDEGGGPAPIAGEKVGFGYEPKTKVLKDVQMNLRAGTTLAVVGPTGSGKTTLSLLMSRLWDPDAGSIRIDGRDLRSFAVSELPREVAYVAQTAFLFDDTVTGNITLGADISADQIEAAARMAGAHDFITELPDGYDTDLGERGTTLSGGQRQRIALARALVRQPRLLILDDATSAVDPSVEAEILRGLKHAKLPSTVVIVAYRPAAIRLADEVIYVDEGKIMAHGIHQDLVESMPGYARLVEAYEVESLRLAGGTP